jgi:hypothetical protein
LAVDEELERAGSPLSFEYLFNGTAPIAVPPPDDFPQVSYITPEQVPSYLEQLEGVRSRLPPRGPPRGPLLDEFRSWLVRARDSQRGLVFFYY